MNRLLKFKNIHVNKRCIIIGNGPSLNRMDLSFLKNEITFGLNKIYLGFQKFNFYPTYYVAVNQLVIEQARQQINKIRCPKFISNRGINNVVNDQNTFIIKTTPPPIGRFSRDIKKGINEGSTVTYATMQIAYYMGFKEVVLIGVDHNFPDSKGNPHEKKKVKLHDINHFDSNYFEIGSTWNLPDLNDSEENYRIAKQTYEADCRKIYDATLEGKLNIFEKIDYKILLKTSYNKKNIVTSPPSEHSEREMFQIANQYLRNDQLNDAAEAYVRLCEKTPGFHPYINNLKKTYQQLNKKKQTISNELRKKILSIIGLTI